MKRSWVVLQLNLLLNSFCSCCERILYEWYVIEFKLKSFKIFRLVWLNQRNISFLSFSWIIKCIHSLKEKHSQSNNFKERKIIFKLRTARHLIISAPPKQNCNPLMAMQRSWVVNLIFCPFCSCCEQSTRDWNLLQIEKVPNISNGFECWA
jgi:hypothetical protein